jgi:hypothetical protein
MLATTILGFTLSAMWAAFLVFMWVLIALIPASIARSKGHSFFLWFIVSLFFWWITLFVVLFMKDKSDYTPTPVHHN